MTSAVNSELRGHDTGIARSMVGMRLGRYEILCELATGGMATVHIARAQGVAGFERLVALKLLHPHLAHEEEFISMFLDEARLAARIRHPNVVATQDISDSEGDGFFLVMDYVEGDHLGSLLARSARQGKRVPEPIAARLLMDALDGLSAAHQLVDELGAPLNIVHRDISPQNILVGTDGIGRLTDFGVAKAEVRMSSTRAGQFKGKLSYMAPEQASTGHCDQRSDLFAMAIVLWESLTGRRLFRGESNAATLSKILVDPIPLPSEFVPELAHWDPVLAKALARNPDQRFQCAEDFVEAIEEVAGMHGGVATARAVGVLVRELVGDKVEVEQGRIKAAIGRSNASSGGTQTRIPIAATPSRVSIPSSPSRPSIPPVPSRSAIPVSSSRSDIPLMPTHSGIVARNGQLIAEVNADGQVVLVQEHSRRTTVLLVVGLLLVAGMAAVAGFFVSRGQSSAERVIVSAPPPVAPAAPVAAPPAALAPAAPPVAPTAIVTTSPTVDQAATSPSNGTSRRRGSRARTSEAATNATPVESSTTMTATSTTQAQTQTHTVTRSAADDPDPNPYRGY